MTVETRYMVIRNGDEVMSTTDKKEADKYDQMLDMADALFAIIGRSDIELTDADRDSLSIYLAQNKEDVLVALGAKRPKKKTSAKSAPKLKTVESIPPAQDAVNL